MVVVADGLRPVASAYNSHHFLYNWLLHFLCAHIAFHFCFHFTVFVVFTAFIVIVVLCFFFFLLQQLCKLFTKIVGLLAGHMLFIPHPASLQPLVETISSCVDFFVLGDSNNLCRPSGGGLFGFSWLSFYRKVFAQINFSPALLLRRNWVSSIICLA